MSRAPRNAASGPLSTKTGPLAISRSQPEGIATIMSQPPASAVENIPAATLARIADLAAGFDGTTLLGTSSENQVQTLLHLAAVSAELYLTTTIALETSGVGLPLPAVPRQRTSDETTSRLRGARSPR